MTKRLGRLQQLLLTRCQACSPLFPVSVGVDCPYLPSDEAESLVLSTQQRLFDLNDLPVHQIKLELATSNSRTPNSSLKVILSPSAATTEPTFILQPNYLEAFYNPEQKDGPLSFSLAAQIDQMFAEERAMIVHLNPHISHQLKTESTTRAMLSNLEKELEHRRTRSMMYSSTYHVTFSLLTPEAYPSDWEIEEVLNDTINPLLQGLRVMYNFTVDTQVQPYSTLPPSVQPLYDDSRKAWILQRSDLRGFINAAEWPLNPSIRPGPTINFVLFVPPASKSPLLVEGYRSNSWLIPQWGSVLVYNPRSRKDLEKTRSLAASELIEPFRVFSQNLVALLGLPSADQPILFRIRSQMRLLSFRLISYAASTLGSTARLTESLPSISIPPNVASAVDDAISHLHAACADMRSGQTEDALRNARIAEGTSDKAFFDKSMVGQAYFPEEHKVAVYLPMMGPIAVPLLMSAIKEVKALRSWFRARPQGFLIPVSYTVPKYSIPGMKRL